VCFALNLGSGGGLLVAAAAEGNLIGAVSRGGLHDRVNKSASKVQRRHDGLYYAVLIRIPNYFYTKHFYVFLHF
jgi:hypothetical protein